MKTNSFSFSFVLINTIVLLCVDWIHWIPNCGLWNLRNAYRKCKWRNRKGKEKLFRLMRKKPKYLIICYIAITQQQHSLIILFCYFGTRGPEKSKKITEIYVNKDYGDMSHKRYLFQMPRTYATYSNGIRNIHAFSLTESAVFGCVLLATLIRNNVCGFTDSRMSIWIGTKCRFPHWKFFFCIFVAKNRNIPIKVECAINSFFIASFVGFNANRKRIINSNYFLMKKLSKCLTTHQIEIETMKTVLIFTKGSNGMKLLFAFYLQPLSKFNSQNSNRGENYQAIIFANAHTIYTSKESWAARGKEHVFWFLILLRGILLILNFCRNLLKLLRKTK